MDGGGWLVGERKGPSVAAALSFRRRAALQEMSEAPEKERREPRRVGKRRRERGRRQAQRSARRNTNQLRQGFATGMSYPHLASASRSGAEKQIWMGHSSLPSAMTTAGLDGQARLQQI